MSANALSVAVFEVVVVTRSGSGSAMYSTSSS